MDLTFLGKPERRVVGMLIAAGACIWGGWKIRDFIGDAQAAEARVSRVERRLSRIERNQARLMGYFRLTPEPEEDEAIPLRATAILP